MLKTIKAIFELELDQSVLTELNKIFTLLMEDIRYELTGN